MTVGRSFADEELHLGDDRAVGVVEREGERRLRSRAAERHDGVDAVVRTGRTGREQDAVTDRGSHAVDRRESAVGVHRERTGHVGVGRERDGRDEANLALRRRLRDRAAGDGERIDEPEDDPRLRGHGVIVDDGAGDAARAVAGRERDGVVVDEVAGLPLVRETDRIGARAVVHLERATSDVDREAAVGRADDRVVDRGFGSSEDHEAKLGETGDRETAVGGIGDHDAAAEDLEAGFDAGLEIVGKHVLAHFGRLSLSSQCRHVITRSLDPSRGSDESSWFRGRSSRPPRGT